MFIVLEGPDAVGKTTQVRLLKSRLQDLGRNVLTVQDPGHTRVGELLRVILKDKTIDMRPITQALLFAAARAETAKEVHAFLEAGGDVIADRWLLSTYVYQGYMQGVDQELLKHIADKAYMGLTPDLTILLDMDSAAAGARRGTANTAGDRFESQGLEFQASLRAAYLGIGRTMPGVQVLDVDGLAMDEVHHRIFTACGQHSLVAV